ncbi:hypothetical protein GU926_06610 [Nibribacter ruber]|uniref:Uncharacterized protein n=1 Tax=Nibribacter ruber TaxID=2698458 RepID=A0A6P1NTS0_9BACT|nr:hypothetical protein [Nibribacter ruber]QHL87117.1 hypothetical protein GU926_06610 [Nibribacter ruber]
MKLYLALILAFNSLLVTSFPAYGAPLTILLRLHEPTDTPNPLPLKA